MGRCRHPRSMRLTDDDGRFSCAACGDELDDQGETKRADRGAAVTHGQDAGAASEVAVELARRKIMAAKVGLNTPRPAAVLANAAAAALHEPRLGDARSVNEAWCRADQTRQIVKWIQQRSGVGSAAQQRAVIDLANRLARAFGAQP